MRLYRKLEGDENTHVALVLNALATSFAAVWSAPWHTTHPTSDWLCLLSFQSETILGVVLE